MKKKDGEWRYRKEERRKKKEERREREKERLREKGKERERARDTISSNFNYCWLNTQRKATGDDRN